MILYHWELDLLVLFWFPHAEAMLYEFARTTSSRKTCILQNKLLVSIPLIHFAVRTCRCVLGGGFVQEHKQIAPLVRVNLPQLEVQVPHVELPVVGRFQLFRDLDASVVACGNVKRCCQGCCEIHS